MTVPLPRFSPRELVLAPDAAWEALRFFFPADVVGVYPEDLARDDLLFAQSLLVAAIDETRRRGAPEGPEGVPLVAAGWVRIRAVAAQVVARVAPGRFGVALPEGWDGARIDEVARAAVSIRHRAGWMAHVRGGPLL